MGSNTSKQVLCQEEAEALCANRFDLNTFNANKNSQGLIRTSFLRKHAATLNEKEVRSIFDNYSHQGAMDIVQWIKLCKSSKLLSKRRKFLLPDAHVLFQRAFSEKAQQTARTSGRTKPMAVHYTTFRFVLLLGVAVHKRVGIDTILTCIIKNHAPQKATLVPESPINQNKSTLLLSSRRSSRFEMSYHQAKLYQKRARFTLKKLSKICPDSITSPIPSPSKSTTSHHKRQKLYKTMTSASSEDKLCAIFMSYTGGAKVMTLEQFLQMCTACDLVQSNFRIKDVKVVFKNAILMASLPSAGKELNEGVVDNNLMKYSIFRSFAIPHIAQKMKKNSSDIISLFA